MFNTNSVFYNFAAMIKWTKQKPELLFEQTQFCLQPAPV